MQERNRSGVIDVVVAASLSALAFVVYRKVLRLYWMYDDAFLINILQPSTIFETLYSKGLYARMGRPIFNPLLLLSWRLDLEMFGLNPRAIYLHQIVSFALLAALLFILLRLWSSRLAAGAAVVVFTISGPTLQVVPQLMLRHYVEGAVLAVAATIAFVHAARRERMRLAVLSAFLYLCAAAAKEVYAPLILILIVMPEGTLRERLRLAAPHAIAAAGFIAWRVMVIGWSVAPFGFVVPRHKLAATIASIPLRVVRQFAGSGSWAGWILVAMCAACVLLVLVRMPAARRVAIAAIVAAVVPIIPVAGEMQPRWAFAPWLLTCSLIALAAIAIPRRELTIAVVAVIVGFAAFRTEWPGPYRVFLRMSNEARVFSTLASGDVLRDPAAPPASLQELKRLTASQGRAFYDDLPLCDASQRVGRLFEYDPDSRQVRQATRTRVEKSCALTRTMPLQFHLHFERNGAFYWKAGPYRDGSWAFILGEGLDRYDVPAEAGFRAPGLEQFDLRVRYTSPQGWKTYTPILRANSRSGPIDYQQ